MMLVRRVLCNNVARNCLQNTINCDIGWGCIRMSVLPLKFWEHVMREAIIMVLVDSGLVVYMKTPVPLQEHNLLPI